MKKKSKIFIFLSLFFLVLFLISTQFILPPKNNTGGIININVYIIEIEIFLFLFFVIMSILKNFNKINFLNIIKNAVIIPATIVSLSLLNIFGSLDILMIITIPLSAIILYIFLNTI